MICDDLNIAKEICYKRKQEVKGINSFLKYKLI